MVLPRQYTVVDNGSYIDFIGVAGTLAEGLTFSLQKQNITKLSIKDQAGSISFYLADTTINSWAYDSLIDPTTGLPFVDLATAVAYFMSIGTVAGGGGSAISADGDTMYSNISGEFAASVDPGTLDIITDIIVGSPLFPLSASKIVSLKLIDTNDELITLPISGATVNLGVITVNGYTTNFVAGDQIIVTLQGPKKGFNVARDSFKSLVQNPEYAHTIVPIVLADALTTPIAIESLEAMNAVPGLPFENDGSVTPYGENNVLIGGRMENLTTGETGTITDVVANTNIQGTLSGAGTWTSGHLGNFEGVRRFIVDMDTYKYLTIQYKLVAPLQDDITMKVYGSNVVSANADSLDGWVDMSLFFLGAADIVATDETLEGMIMPTTPVTLQQVMIQLASYNDGTAPQAIEYTLIVKTA